VIIKALPQNIFRPSSAAAADQLHTLLRAIINGFFGKQKRNFLVIFMANNFSTYTGRTKKIYWEAVMKQINLYDANGFADKGLKRLLVHDSPYFRILNFNFKAGQELPVHSHELEGQLSLTVLEGEGEFLGKDGTSFPGKQGDVVIAEISEPHGFRAKTQVRLLVTIAPPL
jgi:quercetin dioxygenase-like cupin family protein